MEKVSEKHDFIDGVKHSGFFVFSIAFAYFIPMFFSFYPLLSLESKRTQRGVFKNM